MLLQYPSLLPLSHLLVLILPESTHHFTVHSYVACYVEHELSRVSGTQDKTRGRFLADFYERLRDYPDSYLIQSILYYGEINSKEI